MLSTGPLCSSGFEQGRRSGANLRPSRLAPLIVLVRTSLSGDSYMACSRYSWSLKWCPAIFADGRMLAASGTSLGFALVVTVLSLVVGLPAALCDTRQATRLLPCLAVALLRVRAT